MIQKLSVGMEDLKKQLGLIDIRVDKLAGRLGFEDQEETDLLDGLANFLSCLNEALEAVEPGCAVEVFKGKG